MDRGARDPHWGGCCLDLPFAARGGMGAWGAENIKRARKMTHFFGDPAGCGPRSRAGIFSEYGTTQWGRDACFFLFGEGCGVSLFVAVFFVAGKSYFLAFLRGVPRESISGLC